MNNKKAYDVVVYEKDSDDVSLEFTIIGNKKAIIDIKDMYEAKDYHVEACELACKRYLVTDPVSLQGYNTYMIPEVVSWKNRE